MIKLVCKKPEIYRILLPLKNNSLKTMNCYVIKSENESLVIDTGFPEESCKEALLSGLNKLGLTPSDTELFLTHLHTDHTGLTELFVNNKHHIYIGEKEYFFWKQLGSHTSFWDRLEERYIKQGFPAELLKKQKIFHPSEIYSTNNNIPVTTLTDKESFQIGGVALTCIETPGHTFGHTCLYIPKEQILFLGDCIIYDIPTYISVWSNDNNPLGSYLNSLNKLKKLDISLALPSHHGDNEKSLVKRISELEEHHYRRLAEVRNILKCADSLTLYEIANNMHWPFHGHTWNTFSAKQNISVMSETEAYVLYLEANGEILRKTDGKYKLI